MNASRLGKLSKFLRMRLEVISLTKFERGKSVMAVELNLLCDRV